MNEDQIEQYALELLSSLGWEILHGPDIEPDGDGLYGVLRQYDEVVLVEYLRNSISKLNPHILESAQNEALRKVITNFSADLVTNNHNFHQLLTRGVPVEYCTSSGELKSDLVWLVDFANPDNNDFVAVNQMTIKQDKAHRRPDIVLFINGLPIGVIELKNAVDNKADVRAAFNQIQTYKNEISNLFRFNELCVISDGLDARIGTISSNFERMMAWKTIDGDSEVGKTPLLEVFLRGICDKKRLINLIQNFIVFERDDGEKLIKKVAAYHQYWVAEKALQKTLEASGVSGDRRAGVVWHTQGSGKSLSMVFYAGKLIHDLRMNNPTLVIVTDRNDLDGQLFGTFSNCQELIGETPIQAESRSDLRQLLQREAGGVIFTTIQKFAPDAGDDSLPVLTDRTNVIVMADEAHRSQYGIKAHVRYSDNEANLVYGYAKYMRDALPNASYIGFTGTPIETADRSTPAIFGDYVDIYDIKRAVDDGATVPIYYESRLVDLGLDDATRQWLDNQVDELLNNEDETRQSQLKSEWAAKQAIVGNKKRLELVAQDLVLHFEKRQEIVGGKAMAVTMSRQIAVDLYDQIIKLRPDWHSDNDLSGKIKIIFTGSASDKPELQAHIRNKQRQHEIEKRFKNPQDELKLVIVCDMWLTGFDIPCLNTMYLDKPLKGHGLMQAITRTNRVYPGKVGGVIVDYLGVAAALREAMQNYTRSGGQGASQLDLAEAIAQMMTRYEVLRDLFHGFNYNEYFTASIKDKLQIILDAEEFILRVNDGQKRLRQAMLELMKAFGLVIPHETALAIRDEVAFFQAVNARLDKISRDGGASGISDEEYRLVFKQMIDKAIEPQGVVDVFAAAGLEKPEISILSEAFFAEIRGAKRKNLAVATLQKLLNDEIRVHFKTNAVKNEKFSEMLAQALQRYKNGTVEAAQVIEELIEIGRSLRKDIERSAESDLTSDEIAFYDALVENGSAVAVMDDSQLRNLAKILVEQIRRDASVDWKIKRSVQARLRINVKKLLAKYGYPPDQQQIATDRILKQSMLMADDVSTS